MCTCANRVVKDLSLVVLWVGRARTRCENWVRWVECRMMKREGEARLDNHRVMRVSREAWWAVRSKRWLTCCLDGDDVDPMRCRL